MESDRDCKATEASVSCTVFSTALNAADEWLVAKCLYNLSAGGLLLYPHIYVHETVKLWSKSCSHFLTQSLFPRLKAFEIDISDMFAPFNSE